MSKSYFIFLLTLEIEFLTSKSCNTLQKIFHGETFGGNLWGGVVVDGGTYDQIMLREGELYKCIFQ